MASDKEIKRKFKEKTLKKPDNYYPTAVLKDNGFSRLKCTHCENFFWSTVEKSHCEEPECRAASGLNPYGFIGNSPSKKSLSYEDTWKKAWVPIFKKLNHTPISRYPIVARWRDDTYWVRASIYNFQPHVVSGAVKPPANPLIVPQICIRTNDIDNVGLSGRHFSTFVMVGQHVFNRPDNFIYFKDKAISYILQYLKSGIGLPKEEITFHEDAWAGGGNFGPSLEFFSQGLELGNQVYMQYQVTPSGPLELETTVIDMGAGLGRSTWLMQGKPTQYDVAFPKVLSKLYRETGIKPDKKIWAAYANLSGTMNVDEVNIEKAWSTIAEKLSLSEKELREAIYPMRALYAIADHTRSLLVALYDGALPSNVGGGYSLRYLLRRCWALQNEFGFDFSLEDVMEGHVKEFGKLFSELEMGSIPKILDVEKRRYKETLSRGRRLITSSLSKGGLKTSDMIKLYDSHGILPEMIERVAKEAGKEVKIPSDFYNRLDEIHEKRELPDQKGRRKLPKLPPTVRLNQLDFSAKVLWSEEKKVILDKTGFYPTSGGQAHDVGTLNGIEVVDVEKEGPYVIHKLKSPIKSKKVKGSVQRERRIALTRHHTATHIVNAAAQEVLGSHVWQAGAEKKPEKARLDITHYQSVTPSQLDEIESVANRIVLENIPLKKEELSRADAEKRYGFSIYQGGVVPGDKVRIVAIGEKEIEACGGTHCDYTGEVGMIQIISAERIQDGVVRLEFTAGLPAINYSQSRKKILRDSASILSVSPEILPKTVERFFNEWKEQKKSIDALRDEVAKLKLETLTPKKIDSISAIISQVETNFSNLEEMAKNLSKKADVVILASTQENSVALVISSNGKLPADKLAKEISKDVGGSAGGNSRFARGGGSDIASLENALKKAEKRVKKLI